MSAALGWPKTESVVRKAIKGEQRKVDNDRLREAVALSNASRGAVGLVISETRIAVTAIWLIGSDVRRLVARCASLADPGRLEHYLLQVIAIGDEDHKVEFAILLHQTSGKSVSICSFLGDTDGVRHLLLN
jgi:hypothetical protein